MDKKEHLNEEKYQETNKKVKRTGLIMIIVGGILFSCFLLSMILQFAMFGQKQSINPMVFGIFGFLGVFGLPILGIGLYLRFVVANGRNITSYIAQQQMPVVKEGTEKMAPTAGKVAKEITKGIKEGWTSEEEKKKK